MAILLVPVNASAAGTGSSPLSVTLNGKPVPGIAANLPEELDAVFRQYTVCEPSGNGVPESFSGWSIATLIEAAGSTPQTASLVTVQRYPSTGEPVMLTPPDFDPSTPGGLDFPEGPALLVTRGFPPQDGPFQFFRPYRGTLAQGCAGDPHPNNKDWVIPAGGVKLKIAITAGAVLQVQAAASSLTPKAGTNDTFTASVSNPPQGVPLTYTWNFGDGKASQGSTVTHAFAAAGSYDVIATVSGTDRSGGSAQVNLNVGKAQGPPGHGTTTTTVAPSKLPTVGGVTSTTSVTPPRPPTPGGESSATPVGGHSSGTSSIGYSGATLSSGHAPKAARGATSGEANPPGGSPSGLSLVSVSGVLIASGPLPNYSGSHSATAQTAQGPIGRHRSGNSLSWKPVAVGVSVLILLSLGVLSERRPRVGRAVRPR
jgi:hypothetical protein